MLIHRYLSNSRYGLSFTIKKRAALLQCSSVLRIQHTVLDRPILGSKFSRKFNIHNCHLVSGTEGKGVYLKGDCAPTNHPFKALEFVLINNLALKFRLYFGLYDKALLVSYYISSSSNI